MVHERAVGVGTAIDPDSVYVGSTDIATYGALVENYTISGTAITNAQYKGINRTNFNLLKQTYGYKQITLNLVLIDDTRKDLVTNKSQLDSLFTGKVELLMPDGFYYTAFLQTAGELTIIGQNNNEVLAQCKYTFSGIQHDALVTATGNTVNCSSTMPYTDCRLTCTASQAYQELQIGPVTVTDVAQGDVIVADGINGRILQNGAPCAGNMSFIHFPTLVPGSNTITCPETLTVEYYPTYI